MENEKDFNWDTWENSRDYNRDRSRRTSTEKESGKKVDYLSKLILVQLIVCAVIFAFAFITSKVAPSAFEQLKSAYSGIMSNDMTASEVVQALKKFSGFVLLPSDKFSDDKTTEVSTAAENTTAESIKNVAATSLPSGGKDIEGMAAEKNTSFAPYYITTQITPPVKGKITCIFGYRIHPITGKYGFHTGLDIGANMGDSIVAAYYGKVKEIGYTSSVGNYIILKHQDGLETFYCHCSKILAQKGAVIRQGERIALVGSTGSSTGPHLHFEIRINGIRCNPALLLSKYYEYKT